MTSDETRDTQVDSHRLGRVRFTRQLSAGTFSAVWLVRCEQSHRHLACKVVRFAERGFGGDMTDTVHEMMADLSTIYTLRHPNLCNALDLATVPDRDTGYPFARVFLQLCDADLLNLLAQPDNAQGMPRQGVVRWLRDIGRALQYLHGNHVVHLDVKPSNILYQRSASGQSGGAGTGTYKLTDLGLAVAFPEDRQMAFYSGDRMGSPQYYAPEMDAHTDYWALPCDVFSLGMSAAEALVGTQLFDRQNKHQIGAAFDQLAAGQAPPVPLNNRIDVDMARLVASMLAVDPYQRPEIQAVVADPVLNH